MKNMFIENYKSLMSKVGKNDLGDVVRFCSLFQSDSVDLYIKFKNSSKSVDDIINLYAECYKLDPEKDILDIMYIFLCNTIYEGFSYHLNSSANLDSILRLGLGTSSIGIKTNERQDYEKLQEMLQPETFRVLQPFHGEKQGSKLYYSNIPILHASYGKMPEWIRELRKNDWVLDDPEYEVSDEARNFITEILKKYEEKYSNSSKMLFILPYLGKKTSTREIEAILADGSPRDVISKIYYDDLNRTDEFYTEHVDGSNIIAIDMNTCFMHVQGIDGQIKKIGLEKGSNAKIQLSSEYKLTEVFIGNTGTMYHVQDLGNEYYFKPALSKDGRTRLYRAYIQEAAYKIQNIINPKNAVRCNVIEINGEFGAIQDKISVDNEATKRFRNYFNFGQGELSSKMIGQILDEYLVDFCLCNYDAHERNFIVDTDGNLRGIDKEQSFRYINEDSAHDMMFSINYNSRYGENPTIYNILFEQMKQGKISCQYLEELRSKANMLSQLPDEQYKKIFEEYAYGKAKTLEEAESLLSSILDRKANILQKIEQLYNGIYNEWSKNRNSQKADSILESAVQATEEVSEQDFKKVAENSIEEKDVAFNALKLASQEPGKDGNIQGQGE